MKPKYLSNGKLTENTSLAVSILLTLAFGEAYTLAFLY